MKFIQLDTIMNRLRSAKLNTLLVFVLFFSLIYMVLDDKHFSGVNFIKETIKEEVIKKKIGKKIQENLEPFYTTPDMNSANVEHELNKAATAAEKEMREEDLTVEKIETPVFQRLFDRFYFSTTTSTLLGYGDIYPVTNISKIIVMIQSLLTVSLIVL